MDRIVQILIPELMKQFLQFLFSKKTFLLPDSFLGTLLRFAILWPAQSSCNFLWRLTRTIKYSASQYEIIEFTTTSGSSVLLYFMLEHLFSIDFLLLTLHSQHFYYHPCKLDFTLFHFPRERRGVVECNKARPRTWPIESVTSERPQCSSAAVLGIRLGDKVGTWNWGISGDLNNHYHWSKLSLLWWW